MALNIIASPPNSFGIEAAASRGFIPVPPEKCGADLPRPIVGRGSAVADIDEDGDLDVVLTQIGGRRSFYETTRLSAITGFDSNS